MANWAELPQELLELIRQRLASLSDQICFSGVCSGWRSVGVGSRHNLPHQIPGLMISSRKNDGEMHHFLRLPEARLYELAEFPVPHQFFCNGSRDGWMVVTDKFLRMNVMNPFSGAQLQLPSATSLPPHFPGSIPSMDYVNKAVLSSNPGLNPDTFVLVIYSCGRLAFCKLGDETWTLIESGLDQWHLDAIYHKGNFFSVCNFGTLFVFDINHQPKMKEIVPAPKSQIWSKRYLVEVGSELLLIERRLEQNIDDFSSTDEEDSDEDEVGDYDNDGYSSYEEDNDEDNSDDDDDNDFDDDYDGDDHGDYDDNSDNNDGDDDENSDNEDDSSIESVHGYDASKFGIVTFSFKAYKLLSSEQKWRRIKSLGNYAVFLGFNSSFSLCTKDFPSLRGDCIFFTDDRMADPNDLQRGHDMGIFNMKSCTIEPLYQDSSQSMKPPPFWISPIPW